MVKPVPQHYTLACPHHMVRSGGHTRYMSNKLRNGYIAITPPAMLLVLRNTRGAQSNHRAGAIVPIADDVVLELEQGELHLFEVCSFRL